jgi:hypothetical protein
MPLEYSHITSHRLIQFPYGKIAFILSLDDARWTQLHGGYRVSYDPRPWLAMLEMGRNTSAIWKELWNELHHQGDVGEASYAAVPHLVRIYQERGIIDSNTYAITAVIELARNQGKNPDVPDWLKVGYFEALGSLARTGAAEILQADDPETVRSILSVLAIFKGLRVCGSFLILYSEVELLDMREGHN